MLLCNILRWSVFMPPHGMAVTGTDCTQMPGIGCTFIGYSSMITSSIRVAYWNSQFRGTHKFLRMYHVFEETLLFEFTLIWRVRRKWWMRMGSSPGGGDRDQKLLYPRRACCCDCPAPDDTVTSWWWCLLFVIAETKNRSQAPYIPLGRYVP
jgi:hypothetical protein